MSRLRTVTIVLTLFVSLGLFQGFADDYSWTDATGNHYWNDEDNWDNDTSGFPSDGNPFLTTDNATISGAGETAILNENINVLNLIID